MLEKSYQIMKKYQFKDEILKAVQAIPFDFSGNIYTQPEKLDTLDAYERFAYSALSVASLFERYEELGVDEKIIAATFPDFEYRILKYYQKESEWGLFKADLKWLAFLFRAEIFKIGSLRFQKFPMDYQEIERSAHDWMPLSKEVKERFPEGFPFINIHIETETDLSPNAVSASLDKAKSFFQETFPDYSAQYFITRTWLIHDGVQKLLDPNTNIVQFANRFEIIASCKNYHQALERIYGSDDLKEIESMEKRSRLEEKAWKNWELLGVSAGVIPLESVSS